MGEIRLFRDHTGKVAELDDRPFDLEDDLQKFLDVRLREMAGIEYVDAQTELGTWRGRRLDTIGIDKDGRLVVIEYKKDSEAGAIKQGLDYIHLLLYHADETYDLLRRTVGHGREIHLKDAWLLCVAGSFSFRDMVAAEYCSIRVELLQHCRFDVGTVALNWVLSPGKTWERERSETESALRSSHRPRRRLLESPTVTLKRENLTSKPILSLPDLSSVSGWKQASEELRTLYMELCKYILAMGPEVSFDPREKKRANFRNNFIIVAVYLKPRSNCVQALAAVKPDSVPMEHGFTHDTGGWPLSHNRLAITINNREKLERAKPLLQQAYERDLTGESFRWGG
ncbi:MAG: hypothetical protein OXH77_06315 [Anaerolineaceae bacterium]|nr:hypothetical protein [Anaerolineaceae bacterium]